MDVFDIHNVKVEKANAMLRYRRFRKIANLFRLIELFLAVVLLTWISSRLPFVIGVFCNYFRLILSVIVSPLFIFVIGNVIVLTLVIKSGLGNPSAVSETGADLYEEILNNVTEDVPPVLEPEQIVYQDKQIVSEVNTKSKPKPKPNCNENFKVNSVSDLDLKVYRRSQSDNLMKRECVLKPDEVSGKLKRSETEINRRKSDDDVVDELSNEEFNRKIEGFIARQVRFHKEEKLAIVVPTVNHNLM